MHRRFDLIEFQIVQGFSQTLEALAALRVDQQMTAANVRALGDQIEAVQRQALGLLDRMGGMLSDLSWTRFVDAANRPEWSDDIARTFDDLVTQIADYSRKRIESSEFDPATANAEMIASFGALESGRITAQSLGNYRAFAKGNFLRGYFETRHGVILTLPSGSNEVPNLYAWLYGVGLLWKLRKKFPQLAGRLSATQANRVATALNDVEGFWRNLASARVRGAPAALTYEGSLFEATLKRVSDDLRALQRAIRAVRQAFALTNGGFDCWDNTLPADGAAPAAWFTLSQPEILAKDDGVIRLAGYDRSRGSWDLADNWQSALPDRISWKGVRFFDYLFLPSERIGHKLNTPGGRLSVRLHAHGWATMGNRVPGSGLGRMPGVWRSTFGLYRGSELLRVLNLVRMNETYGELVVGASQGSGLNAPRYIVNFDDATATAERIWGDALQCPLASPDRLAALFIKQREKLANGQSEPALESHGDWNFSLQEVTPKVTPLPQEQINSLQVQFVDRLAGDATIRPLIAQYEEDRIAFLVLLNLAAPQTLVPQAPHYLDHYQTIYVMPAGKEVIDESMCSSGDEYKGRPGWLDRAARKLQHEYRQGHFPQSPDYMAYVRCFLPQPEMTL